MVDLELSSKQDCQNLCDEAGNDKQVASSPLVCCDSALVEKTGSQTAWMHRSYAEFEEMEILQAKHETSSFDLDRHCSCD